MSDQERRDPNPSEAAATPDETPVPEPAAAPPPPPAAREDLPAEQPATTAAKADLLKRFIALVIDGAIASVIGLIPIIGGVVGALYILLRDGFEFDFMKYRSLGKQVMKLRAVRLDGGEMSMQMSARRNWPLVFGSLTQVLLFIPVVGWLLIPLVGIVAAVLTIIEIVLVLTDAEGRRFGDRFAGTKVIEVAE